MFLVVCRWLLMLIFLIIKLFFYCCWLIMKCIGEIILLCRWLSGRCICGFIVVVYRGLLNWLEYCVSRKRKCGVRVYRCIVNWWLLIVIVRRFCVGFYVGLRKKKCKVLLFIIIWCMIKSMGKVKVWYGGLLFNCGRSVWVRLSIVVFVKLWLIGWICRLEMSWKIISLNFVRVLVVGWICS